MQSKSFLPKKQFLIFLLSAICFCGCRKNDDNENSPFLQTHDLIAPQRINKLLAENKATEFLALDETKVFQKQVGRQKLVKLPLLNIDKSPLTTLTKSDKVTQSITAKKLAEIGTPNIISTNSNFSTDTPPQLFFIEADNRKDTLLACLVNFVPDNTNKENGKDGLWTGKLYEWNLKADTLYVQILEKNKRIDRYYLVRDGQNSGYATNSFWTWLGELIGSVGSAIWDALNWIGFHLGIPGSYVYDEHKVRRVLAADPYTDGGGGGGGGGGANNNYIDYAIWLEPFSGWNPYSPEIIPYHSSGDIDADNLITNLSIVRYDQREFLYNNQSVVEVLTDYLNINGITTDNLEFANWAVDYLMANPNVTIEVFKNWYLGKPEGKDGETSDYDESYWNNPNLTFPNQTLPSFQSFKTAYPGHNASLYDTPAKLYAAIGGDVGTIYSNHPITNQNTCAARLSRALNYSGISIPHIFNAGKEITMKGADNKYYFMGAANMIAWMKKTFGTPTGGNHINSTTAGKWGQSVGFLVVGKKGIYSMLPNDTSITTGFGATGHIDLLDGTCDGSCYYNAQGGIKDIFIWELH